MGGLYLLVLTLFLLFTPTSSLAAQSIKIYTDRDKKTPAAKEIAIVRDVSMSHLFFVVLGEKPSAEKKIAIQLRGTMNDKLSLAQPSGVKKSATSDSYTGALIFTVANWDKIQTVAVTYNEGAAVGETARLVLTDADELEEIITFKVVEKAGSSGGRGVNQINPEDLPGTKLTVEQIFGNFLRYFLIIIGAAAFTATILAGFQYMTAGGDAAKANQARRTILWALVGVIAAALSFVLINLAANIGLLT